MTRLARPRTAAARHPAAPALVPASRTRDRSVGTGSLGPIEVSLRPLQLQARVARVAGQDDFLTWPDFDRGRTGRSKEVRRKLSDRILRSGRSPTCQNGPSTAPASTCEAGSRNAGREVDRDGSGDQPKDLRSPPGMCGGRESVPEPRSSRCAKPVFARDIPDCALSVHAQRVARGQPRSRSRRSRTAPSSSHVGDRSGRT
jgi:hypothetical protein